mgnify:FL=1
MEKINSATGFIRFWVVLSVGWIMLLMTVDLSQNGLWGFLSKLSFRSFMLFILPPVLLLGIGDFLRWVFRGFR